MNTAPLDTDSWGCFREKVFLFQAHGIYVGKAAPNVEPLFPAMIREFMEAHFQIMPRSVQRWIEFVQRRRKTQ